MRSLAVIFATVFIDLLGFGIVIPLLPFYAEHFGGSALTVGLLAVSFSLAQFVFVPLWGRWSDSVGRRPIILIGLLGSFITYVLFGLAQSLVWLFVARTFAGVAGGTIATAQAYVADSTTPENRAKGMGIVGAAFGLGFIFGPAIGGFLSQWGHAAPPLFAAALSLANFAAAWFYLPESLKRTPGEGVPVRRSRIQALERALARPCMPVLLVVYFVVVTAFAGFEATFALFSEHRHGYTAGTIGYLFAFVGVIMAVVQGGLVGRAVRLFGERALVAAGILTVGVGFVLLPLGATKTGLLLALAVISVGMGLNGPAMTALVSKLSDSHDQGGMLGLTQSLGSLARMVGPAWGGFLFDRFGETSPYVSSSALMLVAFVVSAVGLSRRRCARAASASSPNAVGRGVPDPGAENGRGEPNHPLSEPGSGGAPPPGHMDGNG